MTHVGANGQPVAEPPARSPAPKAPAPVIVHAPSRTRGPSFLEFVAWRLLELAATIAAAIAAIGLLLQPPAPANLGALTERLQVTLPLLAMTILIATVVGLPLGYISARAGSWADVAVRALATLGGSLSSVWLSMLLVLLFAVGLGWHPAAGFVPWAQSIPAALASLLLPVFGLGLPLAAELALRFRDGLRAALASPVVRAAEDAGLTRLAALHRHGLRPALAETARGMVLPLALVVPASLIVENVCYLPGLGRMIFSALDARDLATLQAGLVVLVALIAFTRFIARLLEAAADPRVPGRA